MKAVDFCNPLRRDERSIARRLARSEAGVTLIELMIAMTIFAVVASAVAVGMGSALGLTRNNRNRSVAANLASKEMDIIRSTKFTSLPLTDVTTSQTVTGVAYTILRTTTWVTKSGTSVGVCSAPSGTALAFLKVLVRVSWPNMQGVKPVEAETILSPPIGSYNSDKGHLAVMVRDRASAPIDGMVVSAVGPGGTRNVTTVNGCAFFVGLSPGSYTISINQAGFVDGQNVQSPAQAVSISVGAITSAEFVYDRAASVALTITGLATYGVPDGIGARLANTGLSSGNASFTSANSTSGCLAQPTTLYSVADAGLVQNDQNEVTYGSSTNTLAGVLSSKDKNARFVVRFDYPTPAPGCAVDTATLRVYDRVPSGGRTIQAFQANSAWVEGVVNWRYPPTTTGTAATTTSPSTAGWMSFGVSSIVATQLATNNYGFLLRDSVEQGANIFNQLDVREGANDPEMILTWKTVSQCTTTTLAATVDAGVRQTNLTTNYGNDDRMRVRTDLNKNQRSYIKFDLPTIPVGCVLSSATLRLFAEFVDAGRTIEAYRAASSWVESTITWTNQPGMTGSAVTAPSPAGNNLWMTWEIQSLVSAQYSGTNDGLVLKESAENIASGNKEQVLRTSEHATIANRPELVLVFADNPALPSTQNVTGTPLFPYSNGYYAWGGTCADADPEGVNPTTGLAYYPGGQRASAISVTPNQTTSASVTLKSADVRVRLSSNASVAGAVVVAYHDPDSGCPSGMTLGLGVTPADGYVHVGLPYGTWRFQATGKTAVGSWPTVSLSPTTANPQTITVTVN